MMFHKHSPCGSCKHPANAHTCGTFGLGNISNVVSLETIWKDDFFTYETNHCSGGGHVCRCRKFMPDNLSYIEYLAKKKGLV